MYEWQAHLSRTRNNGTRIECEAYMVTVYADNEQEARDIIDEDEPGGTVVDRLERVGEA
jgi:hypothetical protein